MNEHRPIEAFQDEYVEQMAREKRRGMLRILGTEAAEEDRLWFTCWLSVMAHEIGWDAVPR